MKQMNFSKYAPYPSFPVASRAWPDKTITGAPLWCSVDLRDGNQSLNVPMSVEEKIKMFKLLVEMGFKEIEVGFPSSSETEYRFVRTLIEEKMIPKNVTIQVLTQARPRLIEKTLESLLGANKVIVNICNPTSPVQRETVLKKSKSEIITTATDSIDLIKKCAASASIKSVVLEYCPESFTATEPDFALEVCNAVIAAWYPKASNKMIINLAATVEISTPNIFADRVEWFCRNVDNRESLIISVHTHNDRGTAVAAAELAVMAGADRVEGSLFGNGERSGNMDIITMALNLLAQGVDPELDISDIHTIKDTYTKCTKMEISPRHPYAGELIFTAFSGSHQDAISKCLKEREQGTQRKWNVPYLPIDPEDIGWSYGSIIRINSQSGKGGSAYIMEKKFGVTIPSWFRSDFGFEIQSLAERWGKELLPSQIMDCFQKEYLEQQYPYRLQKFSMRAAGTIMVSASLLNTAKNIVFEKAGDTYLAAFITGFMDITGLKFKVAEHTNNTILRNGDILFVAFACIHDDKGSRAYGAGMDTTEARASVKAVISAVNKSIMNNPCRKKKPVKSLEEKIVPAILKIA